MALENYIAGKSVQKVNVDIDKLIDEGLNRHDALHELFGKINLKKASWEERVNPNTVAIFFGAFGVVVLILGFSFRSLFTIILGGAIALIPLMTYRTGRNSSANDVYGFEKANTGLFTLYSSILEDEKESIKKAYKEKKVDEYVESLDYSKYTKVCPQCIETIKVEAKICRFCKSTFTEKEIHAQLEYIKEEASNDFDLDSVVSRIRTVESENQDRIPISSDKAPACPKCGSIHITPNKKGFGLVKSITGFSIVGPIGLLGGLVGSRKIQMACLKCGRRWNLKSTDLF